MAEYSQRREYYNQNTQTQPFNMPLGTVVNGKILTKSGWKEYSKKSGAKTGLTRATDNHEGGKIWVNAWNASKKKGLITFSAIENKKSKEYKRKDGSIAISLLFEVFYKNTGNKVLELGFYNTTTGKVVLSKTGFIISTKSPNGGYCGIFKKQ
jgi:hypothetical protein